MKSFGKIFLFELQYRMRRWDTYLYFIAFFILCFYSIHSSGVFVNYSGAGQRVYANSSITISFFISRMSIWLIAISAALMSVPVIRDKETKTAQYYYTLPITKGGYLLGRLLGTMVILFLVSLAVPLGIILGYSMPGHDPATLQPFHLIYFIQPYLLLIFFNLVATGLIFFSMVCLTRHVLGGYMTAILVIALNMIAQRLFDPMDMRLYTLLDPYGEHAFYAMIRGWNILQRNTALVPFSGWILYNRLIWMGVGVFLFILSYIRFDFAGWIQDRRSSKSARDTAGPAPAVSHLPLVHQSFRSSDHFRHLFYQAGLELGYHLKTVFFLVMICAAGFILFYDAFSLGAPTIGRMLSIKDGYFSIFALVILVFFAGEAVNRERELKLSHIMDTLPIPNWVLTGSRLLSVIGIAFLLSTLVFIAMVFTLLYKGYHDIRWDAYLVESYLILFPYYALLGVLGFAIQVLVRNKFVGHSLMILFFVLNVIAKSLGIEHNLLFYAAPPKPVSGPLSAWAGYSINYSEMNGYEPFAAGRFWFTLYWILFAILLMTVVNLLWRRGIDLTFRERLALMRSRLNRASRSSLFFFGLVFIACGAYIYYNTNILNQYLPQTSTVPFQRMAAYEKKYGQYSGAPQPWITHLGLETALFPDRRRAELTIHFKVDNRSGAVIDTLFLTAPPYLIMGEVSEGVALSPLIRDDELHFYAYKLPHPLLPGAGQEVIVKGYIQYRGFLNETKEDVARFSSKYMHLTDMDLPLLGYEPMMEVRNPAMRKAFGLPLKQAPKQENDTLWKYRNTWSRNSDWVSMDMTISTDTSHTAVAPGKLLREWTEGGRRWFHYSTGENRLPYGFKLYSGKFRTFSQPWVSADKHDSVAVELYCYAGHTRNKDSLFRITGDYLNYLYGSGGQLSLPVLRYVEMPYGAGNISEGTMQEQFERGYRGPNFLDFTASNNVLRDYFGDALAPAAAPGAMVYQALDNYFTESGIESKYPSSYMFPQMFFAPTTQYLSSRSEEKNRERPIRTCYMVPYMSNKVQVAIGSLRYLLGAEKLRTSLLTFRRDHAFSGPPYLLASQLLDYLRAQTPDSLKTRFDEIFDRMIFYRNSIAGVKCRKEDSLYRIDVDVEKHKVEDDGLGNETPVKDEEYIDMGIFTAAISPDSQLPDIIRPVKLKEGMNHITLYAGRPPVKVMVDPHYLLMNQLLLSGKGQQWKKVQIL